MANIAQPVVNISQQMPNQSVLRLCVHLTYMLEPIRQISFCFRVICHISQFAPTQPPTPTPKSPPTCIPHTGAKGPAREGGEVFSQSFICLISQSTPVCLFHTLELEGLTGHSPVICRIIQYTSCAHVRTKGSVRHQSVRHDLSVSHARKLRNQTLR